MNKPTKIIVHSTDVSWTKNRDQFHAVDQYHHSRGFPESRSGSFVGYHSLITGGKNYRPKLDSEEGAHTIGQNLTSLGVAVGFDGDVEYPHPEDYALLKRQVQNWQDSYLIPNEEVHFHREFNPQKTCPGALLGKEWMGELLKRETVGKPEDQEEKQRAILMQKISLLKKLIDLYTQLRKYI